MDRSRTGRRYAARRSLLRGAAELCALVVAAVVAGSALLFLQRAAGPFEIDRAARHIATLHTPALSRAMLDVTNLGADAILLAAFALLALWAGVTRGAGWSRFFVLVTIGAITLDNVVKPLVGRSRPTFDPLVGGRGDSFPSGHVTATTAFLFALALYLSRGTRPVTRGGLWVVALAGSVLMAASRIYLGVHWPTDAVAGLILGAAWTFMCARSQGVLRPSRPTSV